MKKLNFILALVAGFLVLTTFFGCGDDDNLFVGSWKLIEEGSKFEMFTVEDGVTMILEENGAMSYDRSIGTILTYEVKEDILCVYDKSQTETKWYKYNYEIGRKHLKLTLIESSDPKVELQLNSPTNVFLYKRM